jgi:hypothetical protein
VKDFRRDVKRIKMVRSEKWGLEMKLSEVM